MKKITLKTFVLLPIVFILSGCTLETNFRFFNFNLGFDVFAGETDFSIVQVGNKLIWGVPNTEDIFTYSIYKNGELVVNNYKDRFYPLIEASDTKGDKFMVMATDSLDKTYKTSSLKIKEYSTKVSKDDADLRFSAIESYTEEEIQGFMYKKSMPNEKYEMKNGTTYNISKDINSIHIEGFTHGNYRFLFETRNNPVYIFLSNVTLDSILRNNYNLFSYAGGGKNPLFNFVIEGINVLGGGINEDSHNGVDIISLPNVSFQGSGDLTVQGGHSKTHTNGGDDSNTGFAVKADHIYNFMEEKALVLIGGNGGPAIYRGAKGGNGHYPLNANVMIKSVHDNAIAIKGGNGGRGCDSTGVGDHGGSGGDVFTFNYFANYLYKNYSPYFVNIFENPIPGEGGKGYTSDRKGKTGEIIDKL